MGAGPLLVDRVRTLLHPHVPSVVVVVWGTAEGGFPAQINKLTEPVGRVSPVPVYKDQERRDRNLESVRPYMCLEEEEEEPVLYNLLPGVQTGDSDVEVSLRPASNKRIGVSVETLQSLLGTLNRHPRPLLVQPQSSSSGSPW